MALRKWNRTAACDLKSKVRLAFAATFVTVALAACGGGGDDSPASAGPSSNVTPAPGASAGGAVAGNAGAPSSGAPGAPTSDAPAAPSDNSGAATGDSEARVAAVPGTTTLSWTPPTMNDDGTPLKLTGYRIYWGQQKGYYTNSVTVDNPGLTRYVVEQLEPAKWYFVATALSDRGESQFSNEIAMQIL